MASAAPGEGDWMDEVLSFPRETNKEAVQRQLHLRQDTHFGGKQLGGGGGIFREKLTFVPVLER